MVDDVRGEDLDALLVRVGRGLVGDVDVEGEDDGVLLLVLQHRHGLEDVLLVDGACGVCVGGGGGAGRALAGGGGSNHWGGQRCIGMCDIPSGCCFFTGPLDSHPVFPSHVASGRCVLSAAAAGAPAGVVSASPVVGVPGLCWLLRDVLFAHQRRPAGSVLPPPPPPPGRPAHAQPLSP